MPSLKPAFCQPVVYLLLLVPFLLLSCGAKEELATAQANLSSANAELQQAKISLATAEARAVAHATEIAGVRVSLATAEAAAESEHKQVIALDDKLNSTNKELSETRAELDEVKFAADRLLTEAEAALEKQNAKEAQRIAATLAEKHPGSPQAIRAAEIVTLIEKINAERAAAENERLATATEKMRSGSDIVRGITFYYDKTTTQYTDVNSFHLYIGKNDTRVWIRLRIQYTDDDWLFIENFVIKADDQQFDVSPDYFDIERDNDAGVIWEWYDGPVKQSDLRMIQAIIASQKTILRYNGKQYYFDREITATEKQALQNVLDAFVALGGDLGNL